MREQLRHLVEMASLPHITFQVLPYRVGAHPGMHGAFAVMDFPDAADPELVYIENMAGALYLEKAADIRRYGEMFAPRSRPEPGRFAHNGQRTCEAVGEAQDMKTSDLGDVRWRKSTRSGVNGNCVEFAQLNDGDIALRDSKDPSGPVLTFGRAAWSAFLQMPPQIREYRD